MGNKIEIVDYLTSIEVKVHCKRISKVAFAILMFLIVLNGIGLTLLFVASAEAEKILIVPLLIYFATAVYFIRLLLWNTYG